jgi:hypothetical protein
MRHFIRLSSERLRRMTRFQPKKIIEAFCGKSYRVGDLHKRLQGSDGVSAKTFKFVINRQLTRTAQ